MTNEHELAWAAGVFDGDGTASGYVPKQRRSRVVQLTVYQSTTPILERFRTALGGEGLICGPYRGRLYHWTTKRKDVVRLACRALSPSLSDEKRRQLMRAIEGNAELARLITGVRRQPSTELAWAAGFFDAEGSITWSGRSPVLEVAQAEVDGAPGSALLRFASVVGVGRISGPRTVPSAWSRLPQFRWIASSRADVHASVERLWPFLGQEKRAQLRSLR
jgi:hypothetical protein